MREKDTHGLSMGRLYQFGFIVALCTVSALAVLPTDTLPGIDMWDKLNHALAFFMLALLMEKAWPNSALSLRPLLMLLLYGFLIEASQSLLSYRDGSVLDMLANAVGLLSFYLLRFAIGRRRRSVPR